MRRERSRRSKRPREEEEKWPGSPGHNVFRMIMPSNKVGYLIGYQGAAMRRICDDTRACVRVLLCHSHNPDRIVIIHGKDEPHEEFSPAMLAARRVFKRINRCKEDRKHSRRHSRRRHLCSTKLLVDSDQIEYLIGGQKDILKSIQEKTHAYCKISSVDEVMPFYATDNEQVIRIHGQVAKVLRAFEMVLEELRKFVVDKSVIPLFLEKFFEATSHYPPADDSGPSQTLDDSDFYWSRNRYHSRHSCESHGEPTIQQPELPSCDLDAELVHSDYVIDLDQMIQTIEVALQYVDDIIGADGSNIAYIRHTSEAIINIRECFLNKITIEIKGSLVQIERAEQLIQDFVDDFKAPPTPSIDDQPALGSNQDSQYHFEVPPTLSNGALPALPSNQHSQYHFEVPPTPSNGSQPALGSNQHPQYQSPETDFHRSPYQHSQYQSPDINFHRSPYQLSQYQSPNTDFHHSPSLSWYQNVSDRFGRYSDGRSKY